MASSTHAAVTPAGIRDGEPAALAALVERRANAVLAYCETVLGPPEAERAAAEAFARFRAAVATAADPRAFDPETLLLGATRHATADLTPAPAAESGGSGLRRLLHGGRGVAPATCAQIPGLLVGRAERALGEPDQDRLARHLDRHAACGALAERVARAERAYAAPPERTVPTGALTEILLALAAAAPVLAAPDDAFDFGIDLEALPPAIAAHETPGAYEEPEPVEPSTAVVAPLLAPETVVADPAAPDAEPEIAGVEHAEPEFADADHAEQDAEPDGFEEDAPPEGAAVLLGDEAAAPDPPAPERADQDPDGQTEVLPVVAAAGSGIRHPRPPRRDLERPTGTPTHGLLYRFLLPGVVVAATLLIVMVAAGVFRSDPAPRGAATTTSTIPTAPPPGAPPVSSSPATTRTPAQDAAVRRAATKARKAREAKAAAARKRAAERTPAPSSADPTATTGQAPPAAVLPTPARTNGTSTTPRPSRTPAKPSATPAKPSAAPAKPSGGTAERQPGGSSSALPGTQTNAPPAKDPGVFEEGTTP